MPLVLGISLSPTLTRITNLTRITGVNKAVDPTLIKSDPAWKSIDAVLNAIMFRASKALTSLRNPQNTDRIDVDLRMYAGLTILLMQLSGFVDPSKQQGLVSLATADIEAHFDGSSGSNLGKRTMVVLRSSIHAMRDHFRSDLQVDIDKAWMAVRGALDTRQPDVADGRFSLSPLDRADVESVFAEWEHTENGRVNCDRLALAILRGEKEGEGNIGMSFMNTENYVGACYSFSRIVEGVLSGRVGSSAMEM